MIMGVVGVLVVILAIGGFLIFHHPQPAVPGGNNNPPPVSTTTSTKPQEADLFKQAQQAQDAKKWDDAISLYNKVADMGGPLKDSALAAINTVTELRKGTDVGQIEKTKFDEASNALKRKDYAKAQGLFQSVIDLKVPDCLTYAPKAQAQLDQIRPILQDKAEYDAAESAASRNDLDGAIARFDKIANGNGLYASQAKARVSVLPEDEDRDGSER